MTRFAEPFPADPNRRYSAGAGTDGPPPTPGFARRAQPGAKSNRGLLRTVFISVGIALLIGGLATLAYLGYRNQWIDLSENASQDRPAEQLTERATVIFSGEVDTLTTAPGNTVHPGTPASPVAWIASSLITAKSSGATDGVSVKVPSTLVSELGGKRIRITVSAARGNSAALSPFALAYSTGAAGDSGWVVFEPTREFKDFTFNSFVPRRAIGFTHYVGIWSDISGRQIPLAVRRITITAVP